MYIYIALFYLLTTLTLIRAFIFKMDDLVLSLEDLEKSFEEDVNLFENEPETNIEIKYNDIEEVATRYEGSISFKITGLKSSSYNKALLVLTDTKEYNDYKTTKKIKDTLRMILNETKIDCNKSENIICETTELFRSIKTVTRSKNRLAVLAICYYKTASLLHTPIKATHLIPIFKCRKRDLSAFIRKNDWNLFDNEYDFIIKYGHILNKMEHIEEAKNILNVCINNVKYLKGPSSSKISTMSATIWLYVLESKDRKYSSSYISNKLEVGKASIVKYYKYIKHNEAKILSFVSCLSINGTNSNDLSRFDAD